MKNNKSAVVNQIERNPFKFIEQALRDAKNKIQKMKATPQILDSLPDDEKRKKFLKAENKQLRDNLKRMSENVNVLIDKMNQESLRRQKVAALIKDNGSPEGGRIGGSYLAEREV